MTNPKVTYLDTKDTRLDWLEAGNESKNMNSLYNLSKNTEEQILVFFFFFYCFAAMFLFNGTVNINMSVRLCRRHFTDF